MAPGRFRGILWILHTWALSSVVAEEYCNLETFRPTCPPGHVILITKAEYGRMEVGRCLKRDYYVGCSDDVKSILHKMCSGKTTCEVTIPNTDLYERQHCPKDLVSYLDAAYTCLKVSDFSNTSCKDNKRVIFMDGVGGFIASDFSRSLAPGRVTAQGDCPLVLQASRGQKINITLYEFSTGEAVPGLGHYQCTVFATIKEFIGPSFRENVVCRTGNHRQELVYSSKTNQITIELSRPEGPNGGDGYRFLLQYEATGCRDPNVPSDMTLQRRGEQLDVRCNHTGQVWHLVCRDETWVGDFSNCSTGIVMAIIVGIVLGVMIGFCLLLVVYNIRRKRRKQNQTRSPDTGRQGHVVMGKTPEISYGADDPMLPSMHPDVTLDKGCHMICDMTGTMIARGRDRDHVYEKPQSGMEVQCLLSAGQTKTPHPEEDTLMIKALDSGDYGCQFHTHKPWHIHGEKHMELVSPSKCALPT